MSDYNAIYRNAYQVWNTEKEKEKEEGNCNCESDSEYSVSVSGCDNLACADKKE